MTNPTKRFISWDEFEQHALALSEKLKDRTWSKLVCITRGGLMPGMLLSRYLDIKNVDTICLSSYDDETDRQGQLEIIKELRSDDSGILLVDDLVDTGVTFKVAADMMPNAFKACVYAKPNGLPYIDTHQIDVPQDTWLVFPWEL